MDNLDFLSVLQQTHIAANRVKTLTERPDNDTLLNLYAYYK